MRALISKFVTVLVFFIPAAASAQPPFRSNEQIDQVHYRCSGDNPGFWRQAFTVGNIVAGHPIYMLSTLLSGGGDGSAWPENYIEREAYKKIGEQLRVKMAATRTCWGISGEVLKFQTIGVYSSNAVLHTLRALQPKKISLAQYSPANEELLELYERCTPDAPSYKQQGGEENFVFDRVKSALGIEPVLNPYVMGGTFRNVINPMLTYGNPKSCADIDAINKRLIEAYVKIDILMREKIKASGYSLD
jgi:hypothetical protein